MFEVSGSFLLGFTSHCFGIVHHVGFNLKVGRARSSCPFHTLSSIFCTQISCLFFFFINPARIVFGFITNLQYYTFLLVLLFVSVCSPVPPLISLEFSEILVPPLMQFVLHKISYSGFFLSSSYKYFGIFLIILIFSNILVFCFQIQWGFIPQTATVF